MGLSTTYLGLVNLLAVLVGLAVVCTGLYVVIEGHQKFPTDMGYSDWQAWIGVAVGGAIVLVSLLGCCCESTLQNKYIILFFGLLQLIFGILLLVIGSTLSIVAGDYINTIVAAPKATRGIPPGLGGLQADMSDFLLGLFSGCCNGTIPDLRLCPDALDFAGNEYCYEKPDVFTAGIDAGEVGRTTYCTLEGIPNTCRSDIPGFLRSNQILLNVYVWPAGIAFVAFGLMILIASMCSCRIGCLSGKQFNRYQEQNNTNSGGQALTDKRDIKAVIYA